MVKVTIRDSNDSVVQVLCNCIDCCVLTNGEIVALKGDDIFHTIGKIDTDQECIIINDVKLFNVSLSIDSV